MKLTISTVVAVLMLAVVFTGCKKDKDDDRPANAFHIGDSVIAITGGALINYGQDDWYEGFNLDLSLFDDNVTITELSPGIREIEGTGFRFYCEMFSTSESVLTDGVYAYNDTSAIYPVSTFDYGHYTYNYEDGERYYIEGGTVQVKKSGSNYELIINIVDEDDNEVSGYYYGPLQYFVDDDAMAK
jgi:hypothetical protein